MIWIAFIAVAVVIVIAGSNLSRLGDQIAEVTGLGRSWVGLILLATATFYRGQLCPSGPA